MTYINIEINGIKLSIDIDKKRSACFKCGQLIHFAQDATGKFYPIDKDLNGQGWNFHRLFCKKPDYSQLEKNIYNEDRNQEFLNNL